MATVREVDARLQESLMQGRKLLGQMKRKHAELQLLRNTLPRDNATERAELLKLTDEAMKFMINLKEEMKNADEVARKIEGHLLWKDAVRSLFGEDGLQKCYAYMTEQETERAVQYEKLDRKSV